MWFFFCSLLIAAAALATACAAPGASPGGAASVLTGPSPIPPPTFQPAPTTPPFLVGLDGASPITVGRWPAIVSIDTPSGVIRGERPDRLHVTCGSTTIDRPAGFGTIPIACEFLRPGEYLLDVLVTGEYGFEARHHSSMTVTMPPPAILAVYYSVVISYSGGIVDVVFSTRDVEGASRYAWDFGDGQIDRTMLSQVQHRFTKPATGSNERLVTLRALDPHEAILATGSVVGRW